MRGLQYSVREGVIVFTSTRMDTMKERVGRMHDDGWMDWWTDGMGWDGMMRCDCTLIYGNQIDD